MENRYGRTIGLLTAVLALSSSVCWATFIESETNDSRAVADLIPRGPAIWADAGVMELTLGDMDFFSIRLEEGEILMAATTPLEELFAMPDTILGLFDDKAALDEALLVLNDNAGSSDPGDSEENLGSKIEYQATAGATYYIGVTGYDDFDFDRESDTINPGYLHDETGAYVLTVTVIPEPATLSLFAIGLIPFLRRRKLT